MEDKRLITLEDISKAYDGVTVLNHINLYIRQKEFVTLLGPSVCGKTTTLRIIGGFERADSGRVIFDGQDISEIPPYRRRVNTVFQKYALFPHLNVKDNIAFGLKIKKMSAAEIQKKVDYMLDLKLRKEMQLELKSMQQRLGITFLYVTHDQEEALTMSDTIVVMQGGNILQIGTPKSIYDEPSNAFVANFIGESNIFSGTMVRDEMVHFCGADFPCVDSGFGEDKPVDVVIRPEDVLLVGEDVGQVTGVIKSVLFKGVHYEMMIDAGHSIWKVHSTTMQPEGSRVGLSVVPFNIHIMHPMQEEDKQPQEEDAQ